MNNQIKLIRDELKLSPSDIEKKLELPEIWLVAL